MSVCMCIICECRRLHIITFQLKLLQLTCGCKIAFDDNVSGSYWSQLNRNEISCWLEWFFNLHSQIMQWDFYVVFIIDNCFYIRMIDQSVNRIISANYFGNRPTTTKNRTNLLKNTDISQAKRPSLSTFWNVRKIKCICRCPAGLWMIIMCIYKWFIIDTTINEFIKR